jgi:hypothetical protein
MRPRQLLLLCSLVAWALNGNISRGAQDPEPGEQAIQKSHHLGGDLFKLPGPDLPTALLKSLLEKQAQSWIAHKEQLARPENSKKLEQEFNKLREITRLLPQNDPKIASLAEAMKNLDPTKPESWEKVKEQLPESSWPPSKSMAPGLFGGGLPGWVDRLRTGAPSWLPARPGQKTEVQETGSINSAQRPMGNQKQQIPSTPSSQQSAGPETSQSEKQSAAANASPVSPLAQRLVEAASKVQGLNPTLGHSAALRHAIQSLGQSIGEGDPRWQDLAARTARLQGTLEGWRERLHLEKMNFGKELSWPAGLPRPSLPAMHWPESTPALSPDMAPRPRASKWPALAGLVGLGIVAALFWRLQARARKGSAQPAEWRLGPWPVNPAAVATREEIVQAFEYLSLLRLGRSARTWNHRVIARQLSELPGKGRVDQPRARVVEPGVRVLADVYEQARYAPPADDLPPGALAAARTELCLLAGVSAL